MFRWRSGWRREGGCSVPSELEWLLLSGQVSRCCCFPSSIQRANEGALVDWDKMRDTAARGFVASLGDKSFSALVTRHPSTTFSSGTGTTCVQHNDDLLRGEELDLGEAVWGKPRVGSPAPRGGLPPAGRAFDARIVVGAGLPFNRPSKTLSAVRR